MPDYTKLLDEEVRAYIARADELYPPDAVDLDIAGQRRVYDDLCRAFDEGRPEGVRVTDEPYAQVPCRRYETGSPAATVVYYHGGGFVVGGLDSHDSICAELCANTGLRIVAVDYPLAPEHRYPQDFDAAWRAYAAVSDAFDGPVLVAGDSAGGNLAAAVSHKGRAEGRPPAGQLLIYPGLGGSMDLPSYTEYADAPHLTRADIDFYMSVRPGGPPPEGDPFYAPLQDTDFSGLPPTVAITAQCDPLTSDSEDYVARISRAGGRAVWRDEPGLVHGYLRARRMSGKAAASFDRICKALVRLANGAWPALD